MAPTSRNAPCPCGSGRRYKACHGVLAPGPERSPDPTPSLPLEVLLADALAKHQAGLLDEALVGYTAALARHPDHFDALHMLGVVNFQRQDFERARPLIARALELQPEVAPAQRNLRLVDNALRRQHAQRDYQVWIATTEARETASRKALRAAPAAASSPTRFSIVMPTFDSPEPALRACLDSVLAQEYPHWELCIADDASRAPHVRAVLEAYATREPRIRCVFRAVNGHISAASNSALALASGEFVVLLDHDDLLPGHALAEVAVAVGERPQASILYSDEDKIDEHGRRFEPYFKPDWNPLLLTSQNYVSHLGVYRTGLVREVGGFREGIEGAQDWDLLLRCAERVDASTIVHIPRVLYHWRSVEGSTARTMESKHYAAAAQERVVADAFARRGEKAQLRRVMWNTFLQADVPLPRAPGVLVVVLCAPGRSASSWGAFARDAGARCVTLQVAESVLDGHPRVLGSAAAARLNAATAAADEEILMVVDAAIDPPPAALFALWVGEAAREASGPVGVLRLDASRDTAGTAMILDPQAIAAVPWLGEPEGFWGMAGRAALKQNVSAVSIEAFAIRLGLWKSLGGLDLAAFADRYHDVDLCLRASAAGARPVWHPGVQLVDARPIVPARAEPDAGADARAMRLRWACLLAADPTYHPALDRAPRLFELPSS